MKITVAGKSLRVPAAVDMAPAILVVWLLAVQLSTGVAEILLAACLVATLLARRSPISAESWPLGWRSLLTGGPATRWVPWLWLAFVIWYLLSVVFSVEFASSLAKTPKLFRYVLFFLPLAIPWRGRHWRAAFWIQLPLMVILGWFALQSLREGSDRAITYNMHYNTLGQMSAAISLLLLAAFLYGPVSAKRERYLFLLGSAASAGVMIVTLSRAAWLAWWLGVVALVLFRLPRRVALIALLILVLLPIIAIPVMQATRADMFDLSDPEFTRRYDMWRMAMAVVKDHPLTGLGPGSLDLVYDEYKTGVLVGDDKQWLHSHNDMFTVAVRHGIPGAAIWVILALVAYVVFVRRLWRFPRSPGSWLKAGFAGAGASLHLFYLFGCVHDNYPIYIKANLLLLLYGVYVAADRSLAKQPQE
ncbi:MAG: O-antigen ligase family protein [bacterium]